MIIFLPFASGKYEPKKCPGCHKEEDIKEVCRHCGHEYEEDESTWVDGVLAIGLILLLCALIGWLVTTSLEWLFISEHHSLTETMREQWEWLKQIRL